TGLNRDIRGAMHGERLKDAAVEIAIERLSGDPLDEPYGNVGAQSIGPGGSGVMEEGEWSQTPDFFVKPLPAVVNDTGALVEGGHHAIVHDKPVGNPRRMCEDVAHGDRPPGGPHHGLPALEIVAKKNTSICKLGETVRDRVI